MISRRSLLGTGAFVGLGAAGIAGAAVTSQLDDLASAVGIKPRPQPDEGDVDRLERTATDVAALTARVQATGLTHPALAEALDPLSTICEQQLSAVTGATSEPPSIPHDASRALTQLAKNFSTSAKQRSDDAVAAAAPQVAMVLASMAASHRQCELVVRGLA